MVAVIELLINTEFYIFRSKCQLEHVNSVIESRALFILVSGLAKNFGNFLTRENLNTKVKKRLMAIIIILEIRKRLTRIK